MELPGGECKEVYSLNAVSSMFSRSKMKEQSNFNFQEGQSNTNSRGSEKNSNFQEQFSSKNSPPAPKNSPPAPRTVHQLQDQSTSSKNNSSTPKNREDQSTSSKNRREQIMPKVTGFVEARGNTWNDAADKLTDKLGAQNIGLGQIIRIDAHNNGPHADAIFTCYYSTDLGWGALVTRDNLKYRPQNER